MDISYQSAVIFVRDMPAARRFYEELLGQEVALDHGPNVAFTAGFALWQVDHASEIVYGRPPAHSKQLGTENLELYFESTDIEAVWSRLEEAGMRPIHAIRPHPWEQRSFRVYDPDGHIVEIGEPMPMVIQRFLREGLSCEEVAQRTSMPLEIVRQIAGME